MTENKTIIRPATLSDTDSLVDLLRELFGIERDFEFDARKQERGLRRMAADASGERCILVAEREGKILGMCSAQVLISTAEGGPAAMVEDMVVFREYRGTGTGKALLDAIVSWAEASGITRLQLLADKDNETALAFYEHIGWRPTGLICLRRKIIRNEGIGNI